MIGKIRQTRAAGACGTVLALLLWTVPAHAADQTAEVRELERRIKALDDSRYVGGMGPAMQAIATRAVELAQSQLGRPLAKCGPHNPLKGVLIADGKKEQGAEPSPNATLAVARMLAAHLDDERALVRDTAAFALGALGPDAGDAIAGRTFTSRDWTPWQTHAGTRLRCEWLGTENSVSVVPEAVRARWLGTQPREAAFTTPQLMELAVRMLVDPRLVWPDHLFSDWIDRHEAGTDGVPVETMATLGRVIADADRPSAMRSDLAFLLGEWKEKAAPAAPGMREAMQGGDEAVARAAAMALVSVGGEAGVDAAEWVLQQGEGLPKYYQRDYCELGALGARLANYVVPQLQSDNWEEAADAAELLACFGAREGVDPLLAVLEKPVWFLQAAAAKALWTLAPDDSRVTDRLRELETRHWSGIVRDDATRPVPTPPREEGLDFSFNCFHRCFVDHHNGTCAGEDIADGRYSVDGKRYFPVRWNRAIRNPIPKDLPIEIRQDSRPDYGTNAFLRVDGGWLYGTDRWHYDGVFGFVADDGTVQDLEQANQPAFLADLPGFGLTALGRWLFMADDAGVLSSLVRDADGSWRVVPKMALPTVPHAWAMAPSGELLVADTQNSVAVRPDGTITNLQCRK